MSIPMATRSYKIKNELCECLDNASSAAFLGLKSHFHIIREELDKYCPISRPQYFAAVNLFGPPGSGRKRRQNPGN